MCGVVGPNGLEPSTSSVSGKRSNQLSYGPAGVQRLLYLRQAHCGNHTQIAPSHSPLKALHAPHLPPPPRHFTATTFDTIDVVPTLKWALNSAVESHLHTVEVVGSSPTAPPTSLPPS